MSLAGNGFCDDCVDARTFAFELAGTIVGKADAVPPVIATAPPSSIANLAPIPENSAFFFSSLKASSKSKQNNGLTLPETVPPSTSILFGGHAHASSQARSAQCAGG
jgi:hypothetical protein